MSHNPYMIKTMRLLVRLIYILQKGNTHKEIKARSKTVKGKPCPVCVHEELSHKHSKIQQEGELLADPQVQFWFHCPFLVLGLLYKPLQKNKK